MINILKEGKLPVKTKYIFKQKCNNCGCEFEFEMEDCNYISRDMYKREYSLMCPFCKVGLGGTHIFDLEHRVEEVEE